MEYALSCEICSLEYSKPEPIPRMLDCGHSFCTSCITQLENTVCPKCGADIPRDKEFPVNFSLLALVEECKSQKSLSDVMVPIIQNLKTKLDSKMFELSSNKETIESDIRLLTLMEEQILNEEHGNKIEMRKQLRKLEEKYKEFSLFNYLHSDNQDKFPYISLKSTTNDFLQEIYKAVKSSNNVFSFEYIDKKLKFGALTVRDNKIMMHSLSLNEIPKGSKIVQFKNLRESVRARPLHTFVEITTKNSTSHMIIIQPHDVNLVPHFIKLCTAENRSTYKHLLFTKGKNGEVPENFSITDANGQCTFRGRRPVTALESILEVNVPEGLLLDYNKNNSSLVSCVENDVIVTETTNNGFQVFRVIKSNEYSMLGKVLYPTDLWNHVTYDNDQEILDCGLVTEL